MAKICKTLRCTLKVSSSQIHIILLCGLGKKKKKTFLIAHKTQLRQQRTVAMDFLYFSKDQLEEAGGNSQSYFEK